MTPPDFLYFDMGNVLIHFSHEKMAQQMASLAGIAKERAWEILFAQQHGLEWAYERGELNREQFYAQFCEAAGTSSDIHALDVAGSDIFAINEQLCDIASQLAASGRRLGVCSNTTLSHWSHCTTHFPVLTRAFEVHALSYKIGSMKPHPAFYQAAAKLTGAHPRRIFFTDDRPENIDAALSAGWDAVLFESPHQLNHALRQRGVITNF